MTPNLFTYTHKGRDASYTTPCEGTPIYNGVYGHGIVDALSAVAFDGDLHHGDQDDRSIAKLVPRSAGPSLVHSGVE